MEEEIFYTYVYLDPLKPGNYYFNEEVKFDFEPFYVGKGKFNRLKSHLDCKGNNFLKNKIIKRLKSLGLKPLILKLHENLTDKEACTKEIELIKLIGRLQLGLGSLTNMTDGGDGHSGLIQSEHTKAKRVESLKKSTLYETTKSPQFREASSIRFKEFFKNPDNRKAISERMMGEKNPMYGKTTSEKQKEWLRNAWKNGILRAPDNTGKKINRGKNTKKRSDRSKFIINSPNNDEFIVYGLKELQNFCSEQKIQYQLFRKNFNKIITFEIIKSKKLTAINSIGWKIIQIKD